VSNEGWPQYAEYARRLDFVRAEEQARTEGIRASVAQMSTAADDLQARLNGQGGMMLDLAGTLRLRRPKLTPIPPEGHVEPSTDLERAAGILDQGDLEARRASARGERPALLPKLSPIGRSLAVYGSAALVVLLVQALAFLQTGSKTNPFLVLFVIPMIGFAVAYGVMTVGGRPRTKQVVEPDPRYRSRTQVTQLTPKNYIRLGFLLCFGIGPLAAAVLVLVSIQSK
jgi:hypothetical protein